VSTCPDCGVDLVAFAVPESLREHAPDGAATAGICPRCLRVLAVEGEDADGAADDGEPRFDRVTGTFPRGEVGVAFALLLGKLPSLTLEKASVQALREDAERRGVDVALALDRLLSADIDPHFALDRRVSQLDQLL
jgi:hypothetical protein